MGAIDRGLAGRLLIFDALDMTWREVGLRRNPSCPVCGESPTITELIDYEEFCGVNVDRGGSADGVPEMEVTQLQRWLDEGRDFQLIDVREPYEWQICNLEPQGARLTPLGVFPTVVGELDPAIPMVVYCRSGARSANAVEKLREAGFDAINLKGGILAWAEEVDERMPTY